MGRVAKAEAALLEAAKVYAEEGDQETLKRAAYAYGKAKIINANNRDAWKRRKRGKERLVKNG